MTSLYRAGRGESCDSSHITEQKPPRRRSREQIEADLAQRKAKALAEAKAARENLMARRPGNEWSSQ